MISMIKLKSFQIKFMLKIIYMLNAGIILINFLKLFSKNNIFSLKFQISNFWQFFLLFTFFLEFPLFFPFFSQQEFPR
jgi:hypothetical protein